MLKLLMIFKQGGHKTRYKNLRNSWDTLVAQMVKHPTLDFSSGHGLMVREFEPCLVLHDDSVEPCLGFSLSLSLFGPPPLMLSLLKKTKTKTNKQKNLKQIRI